MRFRYIDRQGRERALDDIPSLVGAIREGELTAETLLFDDHVGRWLPAAEHDAFQAATLGGRGARHGDPSGTHPSHSPSGSARPSGAGSAAGVGAGDGQDIDGISGILSDEEAWYYRDQDWEIGPYSRSGLLGLIQSGEIRPDTLVKNRAMRYWLAADTLPVLRPDHNGRGAVHGSSAGAPHTNPPDVGGSAHAGDVSQPGMPSPGPADAAGATSAIALYPMSQTKLIVMSICTFGLYDLYWFYRNWQLRKRLRARDVSPFWRSFFSPVMAYSLFQEVANEAEHQRVRPPWNAGALGLLYFIWAATWRLPDPFWLICLFSFVPLLLVQRTINQLNDRSGNPAPMDDRYSGLNLLAVFLGGLLVLLAMAGTLDPGY